MKVDLDAAIVQERHRLANLELPCTSDDFNLSPAAVERLLADARLEQTQVAHSLEGTGVVGEPGYVGGLNHEFDQKVEKIRRSLKLQHWQTQLRNWSDTRWESQNFENGYWIYSSFTVDRVRYDSLTEQVDALLRALDRLDNQQARAREEALSRQLVQVTWPVGHPNVGTPVITDGENRLIGFTSVTYVVTAQSNPAYRNHSQEIDDTIWAIDVLHRQAEDRDSFSDDVPVTNQQLIMRRQSLERTLTRLLGAPGTIYHKRETKKVCRRFQGDPALVAIVARINEAQRQKEMSDFFIRRFEDLRNYQKKVEYSAAWDEFKYRWTLQTLLSYYKHLRAGSSADVHFCSRDYCRNVYFDRDIDATNGHYTCSACQETCCAQCGASHMGRTCEEYRQALSGDAEFQQLLHNPNSTVRPCPYCLTPTHRTEACYHIDCPFCDSEWNWEYGRPRERSGITTWAHGEAGRAYRVQGDADYRPGMESAYPASQGAVHRRRANHRGLHGDYNPVVNGGYITPRNFDEGIAGSHRPRARDVRAH